MEWVILGICAAIIFFTIKGWGKRPRKVLTLNQVKSRYPINDAEMDSDDPEVLLDLLRDLGTLVYFGAVMEVVQDKKKAAFPSLWSARFTHDAGRHAFGVMGALGDRLCKKIGEMPEAAEADKNRKILASEVVGWAGLKVGIDMRREILEALAQEGGRHW